MVLKINKTELVNAIGYLNLHISRIQGECEKQSPDSIIIEVCLDDMQKLLNTINQKQEKTININVYTDQELEEKRIKPI